MLDQQLQNTIYQFEHKTGVVERIDENTQQLAKALSNGTPIIISTIQKFPFISQAIKTLHAKGEGVKIETRDRRFAVIVDEAHSSQSGETVSALMSASGRVRAKNPFYRRRTLAVAAKAFAFSDGKDVTGFDPAKPNNSALSLSFSALKLCASALRCKAGSIDRAIDEVAKVLEFEP